MKSHEVTTDSLNTAAICDRLKHVRIQVCGARGQSHFAALLHLSPSTYNYYEKGRIPPVDVLDRAARITGAPLLWLIRGEPGDFDIATLRRIEVSAGNAENPQGNGVHDVHAASNMGQGG